MKTKQEIMEDVELYFADGADAKKRKEYGDHSDEVFRIMEEAEDGWRQLPCDAEGPTASQDKEMNVYIRSVSEEIARILQELPA